MGAGVIERAYERHMRATGRCDELPSLGPDERLSGLRAWAVTARAEGEPWQHIGVKIGA